jgi:quercetin dioxygenase-like cupin family protein
MKMAKIIKIDETKFSDKRPTTEKLSESPNLILIHFYLKKGQKINLHSSPSEVITTVVKGKGKFFIGSVENFVELNIGECIKYDPKEPHGFEALEDTVVEAVITPNPQHQKINL